MTPARKNVKDLVEVRKGLHFAAVFLGPVWDRTQDRRADEALERIGAMRHDYDRAFKKARQEAGL